MAPTNLTDCLFLLTKGNTSIESNTTSTNANGTDSELEALLYIVVTLLFYSLGITVGIISYLKREKQEMEEDRVYDQFIAIRNDPMLCTKYEKVQQVISRLQVLENQNKTQMSSNSATENEREHLVQRDQINSSCKIVPGAEKTKADCSVDFKFSVSSKSSNDNDSAVSNKNDSNSEQSVVNYSDEPHRILSSDNNSQISL